MVTFKEYFVELEEQMIIDQDLKNEIKDDVFQTLDRIKLFSNVFDLFTVNFFKTGTDLL